MRSGAMEGDAAEGAVVGARALGRVMPFTGRGCRARSGVKRGLLSLPELLPAGRPLTPALVGRVWRDTRPPSEAEA